MPSGPPVRCWTSIPTHPRLRPSTSSRESYSRPTGTADGGVMPGRGCARARAPVSIRARRSASASASASHCAAVRPRRLLGAPDTMQRRKPLLKMRSMEVAVGFAGLERNRSHAPEPSIPRLSAAPSGEPAAPGGRIRCPAKAGPMEALRWLGGARRLQERRDRQAAAAHRRQVGAQQLRERSGAARHFSLGGAG